MNVGGWSCIFLFLCQLLTLCYANCANNTVGGGTCFGTSSYFHHFAASTSTTTNSNTIYLKQSNIAELTLGTRVMIIQMQGGLDFQMEIDPESANFGKITNYGNLGVFEFNYIAGTQSSCAAGGSVIKLTTQLSNVYTVDEYSSFQVVKTLMCDTVNVIEDIACVPWDGEKGGIVAIEARTLNFNSHSILCGGAGFRGGQYHSTQCTSMDLSLTCESGEGGQKGESHAKYPDFGFCRGGWATGGGGTPCNGTEIGINQNTGYGSGGGGSIGVFLRFFQLLFFEIK